MAEDLRSALGNDLGGISTQGEEVALVSTNNDIQTTATGEAVTEESDDLDHSAPLAMWRKLVFAVGAMPYSMCHTMTGFYFNIFLLEAVILDPTYVLVILLVGRTSDVVFDPAVGYLCSRTRTRFGRLRLWLIASAIPAAVVYTFLWFVPPGIDDIEHSSAVKFIYYLVLYIAYQCILTCIHVPYTALTMHLSHSSKERDSATVYRMGFEILAKIIGVLIYMLYYVGFVGASGEDECEGGKREPNESLRMAYLCQAVTLSAILIVCVLIVFLGIQEQEEEVSRDKSIGFIQALKETLSFRPYNILLTTYLFLWLAVQIFEGSIALYVKYAVGLGDQYPYIITITLIATICWMPPWQVFTVKFGKRAAFNVAVWMLIPGLLAVLYIPFFPYSIYPMTLYGAIGIAAAYLLPWSMLPDVIDKACEERNIRREELFYSFYVAGTKFASGIALAVSMALYKVAGYNEQYCEQPWTVGLTLELFISIVPIFSIQLSLLVFQFYPITEQSRRSTEKVLHRRRSSAKQAALCATASLQNLRSNSLAPVTHETEYEPL